MKFKKLLALCMTAAMFLTAGSGAFAATASGSDEAASATKKVTVSKSTAEPRTYNDGETSGTCGDSMTWSYNTSTSVLTISGSGAMTSHPWDEFKNNIEKVVFSGKITSICELAFGKCKNLESITIPASVKTIGGGAFLNCINLDSVTFASNSNLTAINTTDYEYVENIGWNYYGAFAGCKNLEKIVIPNSVTSIGEYAFLDCTNLETIELSDNLESIKKETFRNCENLKSISLGAKTTSIEAYAFKNCNKMTSVKLNKGLKTIGAFAFYQCYALTNISIPASVETIGGGAFCGLNQLKSVIFESGSKLTFIYTTDYEYAEDNGWGYFGAFAECKNLEKIDIPNSVTFIGKNGFLNCKNLDTIVLSENLEVIKSQTFAGCENLKSISLGSKTTSIEDNAFRNCNKMVSVRFNNGLKYIGEFAFRQCYSLTSISIPASVETIGGGAFFGLSKLKNVSFARDSKLTAINTTGYCYVDEGGWGYFGAFARCQSLTNIVIPDNVTAIGKNTFNGCTGLQSVIIGKHVTDIVNEAFSGCTNLTCIVIPKAVNSIQKNAFLNCSSINTVKYTGSESRWNTLKNDGINATGNEYLLSAPKYIYNYSGAPIVITTQPTNKTVVLGNSVTVSLKATADYLYYQWYYKKVGQSSFTEWSGRTHASETVSPNASWNGIQLYCVLTDPFGKTAQSNTITIKVSSGLEITSHPANVTVHAGDNATFKVAATGTGLKYQWYYKKSGATSWSAWNGRTTASTTATANDSWNKMQVRCKVTDSSNTSLYSNAATITIAAELKITSHPSNVTVASGSNTTFKVVATGTGLKYQWQYKKSGDTSWSNWGSRTTASTTATANDSWNKMQVRCKVTDAAGKYVYSNAATVTIGSSALSITSHPSNVTVHAGDNATFKVVATGTGLKYQWYYKKSGATSWSAWNGRTTASTTATANDSWNKMQVRCKVTDSTGKTVYSNAATITIAAPLKITQQPSNITTSAGNDVAFIIKATGTGLKYQWYYKKIGATTWNVWNGRTTSSTIATANSTWNGMQVRCIVTDAAGTKITSNTIKITLQ